MRRPLSTVNACAFLRRWSRCGAGGHSAGGTGQESTVPRATPGGDGAGLSPAGVDAGEGRV